ncbi:MAG: 2-dehydropantoate 2-reductase [Candidatus Eremiobacteraeota bacterium]|nr:2-dehydropantoate 2-reductase [Candidatus Eremiobacteraeota bacterium]
MRILIAGSGAVGTYLGGKFSLSGHEVVFLSRNKEYCDLVNHQGFSIIENGVVKQGRVSAFQAVQSLFSVCSAFDLCLLTVKGFSTRSLLLELSPFLDKIFHFCAVQNGVGNEEILVGFVEKKKITAGSLTTACSMGSPGVVKAENRGGLALAPLDPNQSLQQWTDLFQRAGIKIRVCKDWVGMKWSKLFLNLIGNGTCAILEMTPQEVFLSHSGFKIERLALVETISVMETSGIKPVLLPFQPVPLYFWGIKHLSEPVLRFLFRKKAVRGRGEKLPSLYFDLLKGKKDTEAPFLYGPLVEKGKSYGISMPALQTLYHLLRDSTAEERQIYRKNPDALYQQILNF